MKIERLRNKKSKLIFLCGFLLVVVLLITLVFKGSKAKYRSSQIIPLINTKVTNNISDFTVMGIYLNDGGPITGKDGKKYTKQEDTYAMPTSGYVINEANSYCTIFANNESKEVTKADNPELQLYTDVLGSHSIKGVKKGYKCHLFFDEGTNEFISAKSYLLNMWGYEDISTITERPETDFTGTTKVMKTGRDTANNRDWVYKAPDDDGTSYYLAGNPKFNWVKFGGYYWRIVRINGDGTIRMIYSGFGSPAEKGDGTLLSKNEVAGILDNRTYKYNQTNNKNPVYVGYKYTEGKLHGKDEQSSIYNIVNNFYEKNLKKYDSYIDKNAGFCNDRTLAADSPVGSTGYVSINTHFAPRQRMHGEPLTGPVLTCTNKSIDGDLFTYKEATNGNKSLDNPIGLLTVDEANFAGVVYYAYGANADNYLHNGKFYWTISPSAYWTSLNATMFYISENGGFASVEVNSTVIGIRPVINLVKSVTFSKGNGTISSPFEI